MLIAAICLGLITLGSHTVIPFLLSKERSTRQQQVGRSWSLLAVPLTLFASLPWLLLVSRSALATVHGVLPEVRLALVLTLGLVSCDLVVLALYRRFDRTSWLLAALLGLVVGLGLGHAFFSLGLGFEETELGPVLAELGEEGWVENVPATLSVRPPALASALRALVLLPVAFAAAAPVVALCGANTFKPSHARGLGLVAAAGLVLLFLTLPVPLRALLIQNRDPLTLLSAALLTLAAPWLPKGMRHSVSILATAVTAVFLSRLVG